MRLWRCFISQLLTGSVMLFVSCQEFNSQGNLSVEQPLPFLLGSDLTVYCHANECERSAQVFLTLNGERVSHQSREKCRFIFKLVRIWEPNSIVFCKLQQDGLTTVIAWMRLVGGLPPDTPENITCTTTRNSSSVECRWREGRNTHVPTSYNVTLSSGNVTSYPITEAGKVVLPRAALEVDRRSWLVVSAHNRLGQSQSETYAMRLADMIIPHSPRITHVYFGNFSTAILLWDGPEDLSLLNASVRLRTDNFSSWEPKESTRLSRDEVKVDGLKPLTDYNFQIRACAAGAGNCSEWSQAVTGRSPGKGPSQPLHAWRILSNRETSSLQDVTVLWKAPDPESYSGQVERYKVVLGHGPAEQEVNCSALFSKCSLQVSSDLPALGFSVVASYGTSPLTSVPLRFSGEPGPEFQLAVPDATGSAMLVSWDKAIKSTSGSEVLYCILEWTGVPNRKNQLNWIKVPPDNNNASIAGLTAGVRYNVTIYAVSRRGVSTPSSILAYSGQLKPDAGPSVSVVVHRPTRLLIQWEDPAVEQQRGFITNYTVYLRTLNMRSQETSVVLLAGVRRQAWLEYPEGAVAIQMSASTSAGEGPRGNPVSSRPMESTAGVTTLVLSMLAVGVFMVQLACWRCVRRRIKQRWALWGPYWLVEKLPQPKNSQAMKQLDTWSEPSFSRTSSDPQLSPISLLSDEPTLQHPLKAVVDGYKPQLTALPPAKQTNQDWSHPMEVESSSGKFGAPLGNLLSSVELDSSAWLLDLELDWSREKWGDTEEHPLSVGETVVNVSLGGGYFPQICIPSSGQEEE
ncbi:interleukin-23 receptor isoform X1 [Corythoichthys intestinalis]|uniref:interleukin-23 receptor isoform X1 n=2 Tax=Corythoichthys intestinalis TaxID=161448 RepID=UPI0025A5B8D4|nr:interleukin-23 receptor isoform X1 [Corythoichthys intestinalis]